MPFEPGHTIKRGQRKPQPGHTMRTKDGATITVPRLSPKMAIKAMCMECLGWEGDPAACTSPLCPLFPYRGRTLLTQRSR